MNSYYLTFALLATIFSGLIGLILILLPVKTLIPKISIWYKKIIHASPISRMSSTRIEPSVKDVGLNQLQLMSNDTHTLLFEESSFDHKIFSVLYLMAPHNQYYTGYVLWQALMSQKLRYSSMKIFHAYEGDDTTGRVLFSVANALEPGYFDADPIEQIKTPGLCFFMQHQSLTTFENMLKVAKRLEHLLGGTLCNHQRQPLSEATMQNYYSKLSSLENAKDHYV